MRAPSPTLLTAGVELGGWNLAAAALHAAGLQRTSATEAAFVVCATGILTPVYAAVAGEKQGHRVWTGCGVALLGALALSLDKSGVLSGGAAAAAGSPSPSSSSLAGDGFVLCAAAFYSAATFRLSVLAPVHASGASGSASSPQALAAAKSAAFAAGAVLWAAASGDLFLGAGHGGPASLLPSAPAAAAAGGEPPLSFAAPLVLAWAALGPGALAAVLQSGAQARVAAGRAQALFATVPLWSAALAGVALGERTGAAGWAGGLLIVAGGALAATAPRES
jgi:drug/metabolite transporter (DMT)-like permease